MNDENKSNNKTVWLIILVGFIVLLAIFGKRDSSDWPRNTARDTAREEAASLCAKVDAAAESQAMSFIYKIDENYMVYVQPAWYALKIDEKNAIAAFVARCRLKGSARFLDSNTGKLLARWGANGYVNYQE